MVRRVLVHGYAAARKVVVGVVGGTVVLIGIALLFLPGPAFLVIPIGLAILGLEFAWARRWLRRVRERTLDAANRLRSGRGQPRPGDDADAPSAER
jgi:tellurite resistance protein TerC